MPRRHQVINNLVISSAGNSGFLQNLAAQDELMVALFGVTGAVVSNGTLTVNIYGTVDQVNMSLIDSFTATATSGTLLTAHRLTGILEPFIYVTWAITGGTGPSFGGVVLDLLFPSPNA